MAWSSPSDRTHRVLPQPHSLETLTQETKLRWGTTPLPQSLAMSLPWWKMRASQKNIHLITKRILPPRGKPTASFCPGQAGRKYGAIPENFAGVCRMCGCKDGGGSRYAPPPLVLNLKTRRGDIKWRFISMQGDQPTFRGKKKH